ncbi:MAG: DNA polymerase III subunit delta [Myxococcales bacterium]|nr:DNA polymerase III subunit delta [Myxococcales bacterium]
MSDELEEVQERLAAGDRSSLYLLWGEEFMVRKAADELVKRLAPGAAAGLSLITLDGASPREIAQELATLPLLPGPKVVLVRDPEFVAPRKGRGDALSKSRDAWKAGRRKEGARRLLSLAARAGWAVGDIDPDNPRSPAAEDWREKLGVELAEADLAFLREVVAFCKEEGLSAPEGDDAALVQLFEKGLPGGHSLVIAATEVDSRCALARFAAERGCLIERKVAARLKDLKKLDLAELEADALAPYGKRLAPKAAELLKERCGGNMRLLRSEMEKLAQYAQGAVIQEADVELLVRHAREEEFLELSDALQKRNLGAALGYVEEALGQDTAPLALLGAVASILRTLVAHGERLRELSQGRLPRSFEEFQARLYPKIAAEAKEGKGSAPHPYACYMGMQAATRYTREELLGGLAACAEADLALKSGGGRLVVERLLWKVWKKP